MPRFTVVCLNRNCQWHGDRWTENMGDPCPRCKGITFHVCPPQTKVNRKVTPKSSKQIDKLARDQIDRYNAAQPNNDLKIVDLAKPYQGDRTARFGFDGKPQAPQGPMVSIDTPHGPAMVPGAPSGIPLMTTSPVTINRTGASEIDHTHPLAKNIERLVK